MKTYPIPMVPGPVKAHPDVLAAYRVDYGSADLEREYVELYTQTEANLKRILQTRSRVVIFLGEGMMALWGALKSCLAPGDRVLAVGTGIFGYGIGDMAAAIGAEVRTVGLPYDQTLSDLTAVAEAVAAFKPKMITAVHCETPSGTLNPLEGLGRLKKETGVPLFYVDAVSSIGGTPVLPDEWHIDLCLGGAQKCLAALPDTCFLSVSAAAWEAIEAVDYAGYDAIKPFRTAVERHYFPYTPGWQATAGLNAGAEAILAEGLEACFRRHADVAAFCRAGSRRSATPSTRRRARCPPRRSPRSRSRPGSTGRTSTGACAPRASWSAAATARWPAPSSAWATWGPRPTWD